jgi:hypothetical protein
MSDYLRSFVISTSAPVLLQWFWNMARDKKKHLTYFRVYSFIAPLYFGIMGMFALFLGKRYGWSIRKRLFIVSIISILLVHTLAYLVMRNRSYPYNSFTTIGWLKYFRRNSIRHLIAFNVIIALGEYCFPSSFLLRVFLIGSCSIFYLYSYGKALRHGKKDQHAYRYYVATEPFIQGMGFVFYLGVGHLLFGWSIPVCLVMWALLSPLLWSNRLGVYSYTDGEWRSNYLRTIIIRVIKALVFWWVYKTIT